MSFKEKSPLGELPDKWKLVQLQEITTKIGSGSTPRGGESSYLPLREEFAFVRSQNIFDYHFDSSEVRFISDESAKKLKSVHLQEDDVLLNITGDGITFARCCIVDAEILPAAVNQHVAIIRLNQEHCLPGYLLAYMCLPDIKKYIASFNAGGSRRAITKGHIESFKIPLAPMKTQRIIDALVCSLIKKSENNIHINKTLESIAQTLFKSWFVDFDPVKAKIRDEQPEGMDKATAALFPDKLVESDELGMIPEGWNSKPLDEIAHYQNGLALQKFRPDSEFDAYLPVLKIAQLRQGYCDGKEKARRDIKEACRVYDGDLIFSWSGTLMVDIWTGGNAALNQHLFKVTSNHYPQSVYMLWTKHHLSKFQKIAADKAVTMGHIKRGHLSESHCAIPPEQVLHEFDKLVAPLVKKGVSLRLENRKLEKLRDTLLPKLLSGELDVSQLETEVA